MFVYSYATFLHTVAGLGYVYSNPDEFKGFAHRLVFVVAWPIILFVRPLVSKKQTPKSDPGVFSSNSAKYRDTLTPVGQFVYDRLTMPDELREEGDPVRQSSYEPCCRDHYGNEAICRLPRGHQSVVEPANG